MRLAKQLVGHEVQQRRGSEGEDDFHRAVREPAQHRGAEHRSHEDERAERRDDEQHACTRHACRRELACEGKPHAQLLGGLGECEQYADPGAGGEADAKQQAVEQEVDGNRDEQAGAHRDARGRRNGNGRHLLTRVGRDQVVTVVVVVTADAVDHLICGQHRRDAECKTDDDVADEGAAHDLREQLDGDYREDDTGCEVEHGIPYARHVGYERAGRRADDREKNRHQRVEQRDAENGRHGTFAVVGLVANIGNAEPSIV